MGKDHCTLWPDGRWGHCCERHDLSYWASDRWRGPKRWTYRWAADWRLFLCVRAEGRPVMAAIMLAGVVLLGPIYGLVRYRWRAWR